MDCIVVVFLIFGKEKGFKRYVVFVSLLIFYLIIISEIMLVVEEMKIF